RRVLFRSGNLAAALQHADSCYTISAQVFGNTHVATARGLSVIGDVYIAMGDNTSASTYRLKSTRMYEAFFDGPNPMLAWQYWDEAERYFNMGNLSKALEYKHKCLDMYYKT